MRLIIKNLYILLLACIFSTNICSEKRSKQTESNASVEVLKAEFEQADQELDSAVKEAYKRYRGVCMTSEIMKATDKRTDAAIKLLDIISPDKEEQKK